MSVPMEVRVDRIRKAIVGGHEDQYINDATFNHAIHMLATLLVPMIDGLAAASMAEAKGLAQRMAQVMQESLASSMREAYSRPPWHLP